MSSTFLSPRTFFVFAMVFVFSAIITEMEGHPKYVYVCNLSGDRKGLCLPVGRCPNGVKQPLCPGDPRTTTVEVCCPIPRPTIRNKPSRESSEEHGKLPFRSTFVDYVIPKPRIGPILEYGLFLFNVTDEPESEAPNENLFSEDRMGAVHNPEQSDQDMHERRNPIGVAEQKCEEYSARTSQSEASVLGLGLSVQPVFVHKPVGVCNEKPLPLIVGGEPAKIAQFPHMAAIGYQASDGSIKWRCGGSLVSEFFVLTAAHCTRTSGGPPYRVRLGNLNLSSAELTTDYQVDFSIPHPDYSLKWKYHDIGLIRLKRPVEFSNLISPACLDTDPKYPMERAVAAGWGQTDNSERPSEELLQVNLPIIDQLECNRLFESSVSVNRGITSSLICAGDLSGGKDTCKGDSGGPLMVSRETNKCRLHYIIGVTSFGPFCGTRNSAGVYTRASWYTRWLEENIWPEGLKKIDE